MSEYKCKEGMIDNRMVNDNHQGGIERVIQRKHDRRDVEGHHGKMGNKKPELSQPHTLPKLKAYNEKMQLWITNQSKFKAAKEWAAKRNFHFGVIDENFLFKSP